MAHESSRTRPPRADERAFVNIKVDREERPDLDRHLPARAADAHRSRRRLAADDVPDARRSAAVFRRHLLSARGALRHAGVPRAAGAGRRYYHEHLEQLRAPAAQIVRALQDLNPPPAAASCAWTREPLRWLPRGGWNAASTPSTAASARRRNSRTPGLVAAAARLARSAADDAPDLQALYMATLSLTRMAEGGLFDQLGGGFCRYSVDARWEIPHFEKMLYDNALLLALYAEAACGHRRAALFAETAERTVEWLLRELRGGDGDAEPADPGAAAARCGQQRRRALLEPGCGLGGPRGPLLCVAA
jgi:uncharacterized protein YyaL (SSP411 family)